MKTINEINSKLFQTIVKPTNDNDRLKVIVKQNNFLAGHIHLNEKNFYNVSRSAKNLFHLLGYASLGMNSEIINIILPYFSINKITIPYEGVGLITTVSKWKQLGVVSPFADKSKIDKQIILDLNEINLDDIDKFSNETDEAEQLNLFCEVV